MDLKVGGALAFGLVIGWYVYYINRYRTGEVQISDITSIIGAVGGGAVLALFDAGTDVFGAYGIGLAIGFFAYFLVLIILVGVSQNFDADWFLDGRRKNPGPDYGYGHSRDSGVAMGLLPTNESPAATTQNFYVGGAPAIQPAVATATTADVAIETFITPDGDDPAAPVGDELSETADLETARIAANLGVGDTAPSIAEAEMEIPAAAAAATVPPLLKLDFGMAEAFLKACMTSMPRVTYGLGAKVPFLNAVPGRDFTRVDCSGFVREAIRRATNPTLAFPDGSVVQHDWVRARGLKRVTVADGKLDDGMLRIAFLRPQDASSHIGHVVLLAHGKTLESHGGVGPDSRSWTGDGWQGKTFVYELAKL